MFSNTTMEPAVFLIGADIPDKIHIKLQRVDRQSGQHIQRGIAAAEIVHLNFVALLAQTGDRINDLL